MAADTDKSDPRQTKGSKKTLIAGLVLAVIGAAGGFFAVSSGALPIGGSSKEQDEVAAEEVAYPEQDFAFVGLDPMVISLPATNGRDHLRFAAQLEVYPAHADAVAAVKPRIVDVLNGYLRAVALTDLEDPAALIRLRAQMLRRIQVVTGPDQVKDLLIMEFVLS